LTSIWLEYLAAMYFPSMTSSIADISCCLILLSHFVACSYFNKSNSNHSTDDDFGFADAWEWRDIRQRNRYRQRRQRY
jgi:hypothetical protein